MRLIVDNREPKEHGWFAHFSGDVQIEWGTLSVGDFALAAIPECGVIERKSCSDMYQCLGRERTRFEAELRRSLHVGSMVVVIEASMADLLTEAHRRGGGMNSASIIGTLAAWQRRFCPFFFAGNVQIAAEFCERFLRGQIKEAERTAKALKTEVAKA